MTNHFLRLVARLGTFSAFRLICLLGFAAGLALSSAGQATLPYITDFDSSLGFTTGSLNGQQNWLVLGGSADVTGTVSLLGNQSVVLEPGATTPEIGMPFAAPSPAQPIVYVDCILKPVASSSISSFIYLDTSLAVLVRNDGVGGGQIFTLDGSLGWVPTPAVFAINNSTNTASNWMRLTFRLDFTAKTWDLYYNGAFVAHDVAFLDDSLTYLPFFIFQGDPGAPSYLNLLYAGPTNLIFPDTNNDGIPDSWITGYGLPLTANDRDLDPDGDGLTNLQEYIAGTDPTDYYNGVLPVIASQVDPSGVPGVLGLVSVKITRASDGALLTNAPVTLAVTTGASHISATPGGTGSSLVTVRTDSTGVARGYVTFTSLASDVLVATAHSGTHMASLSIRLNPSPAAGSGLRLWLNADAGVNTDTGGLVTTWADLSGLGNDAFQNQFHSPQPVASAMNGHSVVRFNGSNDALLLPNVMLDPNRSPPAQINSGEIFIVTRLADLSNNNNGLCQFGNGGGTVYNYANSQVWDDFGTENGDSFHLTNPTPLAQTHLYDSSVSANGISILCLNGAVVRSLTGQTIDFTSTPLLGADWFGEHYTGDIAEVIVYDHVLTDAERSAVNAYLTAKYAIPRNSVPPTVPAGLAASSLTPTSFTLTWAASTDSAGVVAYDIYRNGTLVGSSATTSFHATGLAPNTAYSWTVLALNASGNVSLPSNALGVTTLPDTQAPTVPAGLAASHVGPVSFVLTWAASADNVGVAAYDIYANGTLAGSSATNTFTVTGLTVGNVYAMTVKARDAAGNTSAASTPLSVTTVPDTQAPSAPTGLTASRLLAGSFTLTWTASTDNIGVSAYDIYQNGTLVGSSPTSTFNVISLTAITTYSFTVKARDASGNVSAASTALSVTTTDVPGLPGVCLWLKADTGVSTDSGGLVTTWADQSGLGHDAFQNQFHSPQIITSALNGHAVARFSAGNDALRLPNVMQDPNNPQQEVGAGEIFIVTRLADLSGTNDGLCEFGNGGGTVYNYGLGRIWDDFGTNNSGFYSGPGSALLTQSHIYNSSVGTDGTSILRFNGAVARSLAGQTVDFISDPLLGADWFGDHYNGDIAEVIVYNRVLSDAERLSLTHYLNDRYALGIVFDTTPPTVPTGLNATVVTASSFTLNWTASTDNKQVLNYDILRDGVVIGSSLTPSFNLTGLSALSTYGFTVRARDTSGNVSVASATLSVTTKAALQAPTGLTTTSVGAGSVMVAWTAQSTDAGVTSYNVYNNGVLAGTTTTTSFTLTGLVPTAAQNITVVAVDGAGHTSISSTGLSVTTPDGTSTGAQPTYAFVILPSGYMPGSGNPAYPLQAGISDNGIALLFDASFHTAYRWQSGAIQTLSDPGYNLGGPSFINRTGTIALTAQPPSNSQSSIYNQGPYRADVWLPAASAPQIVQGSTFSGAVVGGVFQNPNGVSPRYYSGGWVPTVFSNHFLLRGLSDDNRVWFNDIDPGSCDAGQVFQSSYPEQGTYRYVDVLVDRSFSSSGGGRTSLGSTHWSYSWPPIGGNNQYLDFPVVDLNPDPVLMGVGASGIAISESLGTGSNPATWYVGTQAVDYEPIFINRNGTVLGRTSGSNYVQQTFTLVLPDGTRHDLPSTGFPTYFWVDDQDRPHGYDSNGNYFLMQPQTVNQQVQYQGLSYLPLSPPSGWTVNYSVPPDIQRPEMGTMKNTTTQENHAFLAFPMGIAVDANRDGVISFSREGNFDNTTAAKPYRFWINDGDDTSAGGTAGVPTVPSSTIDYLQYKIITEYNLQNFTRLWIDMKGSVSMLTAPNNSLQIGLKWQNVTGHPAINLYSSADPTGSLGYLTSDTAAQAQIAGNFNNAITDRNGRQTVDTTGTFILPKTVWSGLTDANPVGHFLFEGAGIGTGQLTLVILDANGNELGEGPSVWLDLREIKSMYLRGVAAPQPSYPYNFTTSQPPAPNITASVDSTGGTFVPDPNEDTTHPTYIVFVHGFNMDYAHSTNYAEIMFKRLWQNGYRRRFASFRWPTYGSGGFEGALGTYNDSEYIAWHSGTALMQFVQQNMAGYQVDVVAHSMGNMVVGEALKEGMVVNHYALLHAATSASCYDNAVSSYPVTNNYTAPDTDNDPFTQSLGYTGCLGGIGSAVTGSMVNFYDEKDAVITTIWAANNFLFKPQSGLSSIGGSYNYVPTAPSQQKVFLNAATGLFTYTTRYVTDPAEARGYVDQSLTGTIGSQPALAGAVTANNPKDVFGNDHSYEWDHPIQDPETTIFYNTSLPNAFGLTTIQLP